jgi:DNA-directed RNA polymerase delta subunit
MESLYTHFEKVTKHLLARSQDIVRERFGVESGEAKTLEEIGKKYSITRERVRQIIRSSLKDVQAKGKEYFAQVLDAIEQTIHSKNGVMSEAHLMELFGKNDTKEKAALSFFLECLADELQIIKEDDHTHRSFAVQSFSHKDWKTIICLMKDLFEAEKQTLDKEEFLEKFLEQHGTKVSKDKVFDFIAVSKEIKVNPFGKIGLTFWSDISPKGTREKAYLVLKVLHSPLHFREITALIDEYGLNKKGKKKTHPQTVHNELIKDARFILVGRGMYALSEWGFAEGTVREVIDEVLSENKEPLSREEIIGRVLKLRKVKKSTIVINLNTFFAKVGKDAYTLKGRA